ncbi:hypothetical protein ACTG9Q_15990 [Actinokineospora sp. 24-640]
MHAKYAATQRALGLESAEPYGLIWLGGPQALVEEFDGVAGVHLHRPRKGRYRLPVINRVPLIPWRYAKDGKTDVDRVPFGHPVSASRASLFEYIDGPSELPLGLEGLGEAAIEKFTPLQREELDAYGEEIRILASECRRVAVIAYASNPDVLLTCYLGYASLKDDGYLDWAFRESLPITASTARHSVRGVGSSLATPAFDAGTPVEHLLRPRNPAEGEPTGTQEAPLNPTATDDA